MRRLLLSLCLLLSLTTACPPRPQPGDGGTVTPSSWTDTARAVLSVLHWAIPAARLAISLLPIDAAAKADILRVLDALSATTIPSLDQAVNTYVARGGDSASRCQAFAAAGATTDALVGVARTLASQGISLGADLEQALTGLGAHVDDLLPACSPDAGWTSAGRATRVTLSALADDARRRGVTLRPLVLVRTDAGTP